MGKDHDGGNGDRHVDSRVARRRQDPIGRRLRQMYDDVVNEDVPDEFLSFLEQADERQSEAAGQEEPAPQQRPVKTEP